MELQGGKDVVSFFRRLAMYYLEHQGSHWISFSRQRNREAKLQYLQKLLDNNNNICLQEVHGKDEILQAIQVLATRFQTCFSWKWTHFTLVTPGLSVPVISHEVWQRGSLSQANRPHVSRPPPRLTAFLPPGGSRRLFPRLPVSMGFELGALFDTQRSRARWSILLQRRYSM